MAETATPLYDLTTTAERPTIGVDGGTYELRAARDLSVMEYKRLERESIRMAVLLSRDDQTCTTAEATELDALLDYWCRRVLVAPDTVHQRLKYPDRVYIWQSFLELSTPRLQATRATNPPEASPLAGTNSSQPSVASTTSHRTRGPRKSRSARSTRTSR